MHALLYNFEFKIQELLVTFRFITFALLVIGLVVHLSRPHSSMAAVIRPLARALTITGLIASMGWWFPLVENTLLATAEYLDSEYTQNPTRAANALRESTTPNPEGGKWSWRKLNESLYHAFTDAVSSLFIFISSSLCLPMYFLQYFLRWILYLLTPFALACFMIPALQGMGVRFFQQVVAILSWPVGFALTNLMTLTLWQECQNAIGPEPATAELAAWSPVISGGGALLAAVTLLVGIISTPIVCQQLFASGAAFTGASASPATLLRAGSEFYGRSGGASAPTHSAASGSGARTAVTPPPSTMPQTPGL